ncbi:MAG: hypothetical protein ACT4N4_03435 [Rhodospirillales bacterium]
MGSTQAAKGIVCGCGAHGCELALDAMAKLAKEAAERKQAES